ncbi:DUF305 domain-containing protein [Cellulomonas sp. 179-A 4D5 NHS]|uniref:DUF305 domain-containing protein n=1 Tax=Cellulomonas sp. 179-A 4D5 NHS TaxID=3142378 RepID=UPI00399F612E
MAAVLVALIVGLCGGVLFASRLLQQPALPGDASLEAGFARDMQAHHGQAVEMALLIRDRSTDPAIQQLALDIVLTQQQQQGQMYGWLSSWGLQQSSSRAPMAWMSQDNGAGHTMTEGAGQPAMPGMATDEQIARLTAADDVEAERVFLELMLRHHQGGVQMAEAAVDQTRRAEVQRLAEAIITSQTAEITVLQDLLEARGGPPNDL